MMIYEIFIHWKKKGISSKTTDRALWQLFHRCNSVISAFLEKVEFDECAEFCIYSFIVAHHNEASGQKGNFNRCDRIFEHISFDFIILIQVSFFRCDLFTPCCYVLDPNSERRYLTNNTSGNWFSEWNFRIKTKNRIFILNCGKIAKIVRRINNKIRIFFSISCMSRPHIRFHIWSK